MKKLKKWARTALRRFAESDSVSERRLGDERRNIGDWTMAARHYRAHVEQNPRDFDIWVQLGHALKETGRYDDADAAYRAADKLDPHNSDLLLCRGHLAKLRGSLDEAADLYSRSFALDSNPDAARELGDLSVQARIPAHPVLARLAGAVDGFAEGTVYGWAVDPNDPSAAPEVEIYVDEAVVARGRADIIRPDLVELGLATRAAGFAIDLDGLIDLEAKPSISARIAGSGDTLAGCPLVAEISPEARRWARRWADAPDSVVESCISRLKQFPPASSISFIVPLRRSEPHLPDLIASLEAQWCNQWSVILAPTDSTPELPRSLLKKLQQNQRVSLLPPRASIGDLLAAAAGELVCVIPPTSVLEPQAVWRILQAAADGADLVYWDEARIGTTRDAVERFILRPCAVREQVDAFPTLLGTVAVRRRLARSIAHSAPADGLDSIGPQALAEVRSAAHIPAVLERRRLRSEAGRTAVPFCQKESLGSEFERRALIVFGPDIPDTCIRGVIETSLISTLRASADVLLVSRKTRAGSIDRLLHRLSGAVDLRICTDDEPAALAINQAVAERADGYDDVVLITHAVFPAGGWLSALSRHLEREDVGVVAPVLADSRGVVASAGLSLSGNLLKRRYAGTALRCGQTRTPGWHHGLVALRPELAADSCIAMRLDTYLEAGGLDPLLSEATMLADLCLRIGETGRRTLIDPDTPLLVGDGLKPTAFTEPLFAERWRDVGSRGDLYWHPALTDSASLISADEAFIPARIFEVAPGLTPFEIARERRGGLPPLTPRLA